MEGRDLCSHRDRDAGDQAVLLLKTSMCSPEACHATVVMGKLPVLCCVDHHQVGNLYYLSFHHFRGLGGWALRISAAY